MPIQPLYEWNEADGSVEVRVQIQGAAKTKADVFATDCLLKINCPPYLLMLDLWGIVDDGKTVVTLSNEGVTFRMTKAKPGAWGQLEAGGEKEAIVKRRNESIDRAHARIEAARKLRLERKQKEEREAIDRQIELERKKRQEIEERKKKELEDERNELKNWQQGLSGQKGEGGGAAASMGGDDDSDYEEDEEEGGTAAAAAAAGASEKPMPDHPDYHGRGWTPSRSQKPSGENDSRLTAVGGGVKPALIDDDDDEDDEDQAASSRAAANGEAESDDDDEAVPGGQGAGSSRGEVVSFKPLPPPRIKLEPVRVEFTKLETGHLPARENREEEIRLYKKSLAQQQQGGAGGKLLEDSVDVTDRQPAFLKDKGDALYRQGNYRGALNAYSRALELDPDGASPALWSNAGACFLQLGDHQQCTASCTKALDMLRPMLSRYESGTMEDDGGKQAETLRKQLVRALVRRGQARAALSLTHDAETDYVEALRYDPGNDSIASDLEELRVTMQPDLDAPALRQRGIARFQAQDYDGAVEAFSLLLAMPEGWALEADRIAALSNRAACLLVQEKYEEAVRDCSQAVQMHLQHQSGPGGSAAAIAADVAPDVASDVAAGVAPATAALGSLTDLSSAKGLRDWLMSLGTVSQPADAVGNVPTTDFDSLPSPASSSSPFRWPYDAGKAGQLSRLLARRGAACAHLKRYEQSVWDYEGARALAALAGDVEREAQLEADVQKLKERLV